MSSLNNRRAIAPLVATGALLIAAFAVASQAQASTLYACAKKNGTAHVFTKKPKCKKGESKLSWNSEGPAGKNGANGASGTNGTNGSNGTNGTNGTDGTDGAVAGYSVVQSKGVSFTETESTKSNTTVVSRSLPAGNYILNGSVLVTAAQSGKNEKGESPLTTYVDATCTLTDTPTSGSSVSDTAFWSGLTNIPVIFIAIGNDTLPFDMAVSTTTTSTVAITCSNDLNDGDDTSPNVFSEEASAGTVVAVETSHNS